jgi:hypothetical protein
VYKIGFEHRLDYSSYGVGNEYKWNSYYEFF